MEYWEGIILMILVGVLIQRSLPQKWNEYMPAYWMALFLVWAHVLLTRPYIWARMIGDLARLTQ